MNARSSSLAFLGLRTGSDLSVFWVLQGFGFLVRAQFKFTSLTVRMESLAVLYSRGQGVQIACQTGCFVQPSKPFSLVSISKLSIHPLSLVALQVPIAEPGLSTLSGAPETRSRCSSPSSAGGRTSDIRSRRCDSGWDPSEIQSGSCWLEVLLRGGCRAALKRAPLESSIFLMFSPPCPQNA